MAANPQAIGRDPISTLMVERRIEISRCQSCDWFHYAKRLKAARQAAYRHIEKTNHIVDVFAATKFSYGFGQLHADGESSRGYLS